MLTLLLIVIGLALTLTVGLDRRDGDGDATAAAGDQRRPLPHAGLPSRAVAAPPDRPRASDEAQLQAWAGEVSAATGVPARALAAYGRAEMWLRGERPGCGLSWATLAAIAGVESEHGSVGGRRIGADGKLTEPIVGASLDGSAGARRVADTDGGRLDGDREWDRTIGPMRLLPRTWQRWGGRAIRDGAQADPQNIDDAALAAARFLCADRRDLATPRGWWDAVLAYHDSVGYARDVYRAEEVYAAATR
ncbi:hypothetical protein SacmaDRAFT_4513 [Saccharomonospora marina XMU15]|uniref:Membrane-bound lytic murein transglycosylase B n=2 Tax=Saccharomonospora TaxID=1851 RepID=H5XAY7_9PSEU|nr:hypothetical protein SacmaDRAFT_4513 [Saccharomonospora marina XMU15]